MRQLILHVGMHKTGTTSIQLSLNGLSESGVKYVGLGSPNHTGPVSAAFAGEPQQGGNRLRMGRTPKQMAAVGKRTLDKLQAELSNKDFHTFIISGEGLVHLPQASLNRLRDTLLTYVDRVKVFAYVREPVGYSTSAFQERTKGGYSGYELTRPDYRLKFAPLIRTFGRENVTLKEFSRSTLRDGSAVVDFCHLWSIPFDPRREIRSNESLSEATVKLVHLFNRSNTVSTGTRELKKARMNMIKEMNGHLKGKFELPADLRARAIDAEDVAWLDKNFGIRFPVLPVPEKRVLTEDFEQFLDRIEPEVVDSYREFLGTLGISTKRDDTATELLEKHFNHCATPEPDQPEKTSRLAAFRKRLGAGLKALSR